MKVQCKKIRFKQNLCWKLFEIYDPEVFLNQDSNHPVYSRVSFELALGSWSLMYGKFHRPRRVQEVFCFVIIVQYLLCDFVRRT